MARNGLVSTRRGERSSGRKQALQVVSRAVRPVIDSLEDRRMLAVTPVISFDFNTDPGAAGTVTNQGSLGAAYNGTLAVDTKGGAVPTFSTASPRTGGGGYLNFSGDGVFQGTGGRIDLASQLQTILGGTGSISFYVRSNQKVPQNADGSFSDAVWQSPSITGVEQAGAGNDIFLGDIDRNGKWRGQAGDGAGTISSSVISDGNWHNVVITRNATSGRTSLYVDGALQSTAVGDTGNKTSVFQAIGALTTVAADGTTVQGYNYYNGDLDQVDIYNSALSATDVAAMYGSATTAPSAPVITNATTGPGDVRLAIGPVTGETALNVFKSTDGGTTFTQIAQIPADSTTFTDPNTVVPGQTYFYRVDAFNNIGTASSNVLQVTVPTTGTGLKAYYYASGFWGQANRPADTGHISLGVPNQTAFVPQVDYNFGGGGPSPIFSGNLLTDNFSTAYLGTLIIPDSFDGQVGVPSTYLVKLISNTDDDGGVFANGQLVSFDPLGHGGRDADTSNSGGFVNAFTVTEGVPVDLIMLQAEQGGGAEAHLKWEVASADGSTAIVTRQIVPENFLHTPQIALTAANAPTINGSGNPDPYSVEVDFTDNATSEIRYDLLRSPGATFNAATAQVVGIGAINGSFATDRAAVPGQTYTYKVRAVNSDGFVDSPTTVTVTVPAISNTPGSGAAGHYFNNNNWGTGVILPPMKGGTPDVNEVVSTAIDFPYGNGGPTGITNLDGFSTIFTGKITIPDNGNATPNETFSVKIFGATDDDGFIYVNGVLVSADSGGHGSRDADTVARDATHFVNNINLTEGQSYNFVMFQRETGGGADAHLRWVNPVTGAREVIPVSALTAFSGAASAPTGIAAPAATLGAHQVMLTWTDTATNEVRYEVDRALVTGGVAGAYTTIATLPINSTSYTDSGLTNNTTYSYRIRAYSYDGSSSTDFQITTLVQDVPPAAPTNIAVLPRAGGNYVLFTDGSLNEANFVVERATVTGGVVGTFAPVGTPAASAAGVSGGRITFTDTSAVVGTTYVYRVHATNLGGDSANITSGNVVTGAQGGVGLQATWFDNIDFTGATVTKNVPLFQDFGNGSPDPLIGPDQFSGILIGSIKAEFSETYTFFTDSDDGIDLTLIDPDTGKILIDHGGAGIGARRGLTGGGANAGFADTAGTATLVAGKSYIIQVRHVEDGGGAGYKVGWSSPSLPQEGIPLDLAFAPTNAETLFAPSNLKGSSLGAEKVTITFVDPNIDDTGYVIERGTSQTGPFTQIGTIPGNIGVDTLSFVDDGSVQPLAPNQTYFYRIHAVRGATAGANSTVLSVQTVVGGTDLVENGNAVVLPGPDGNLATSADNGLQLTANLGNQTSSTWTKYAQQIVTTGKGTAGAPGFSTSFNVIIPATSNPPADGFTFTLQRQSNTALGGGGGAVGFVNIPNSVGVHFRWYNNGNSISNVGVWINGAADNTNEVPTGFLMTNGHSYKVDISYDDTNKAINLTVTDLTDNTVAPFTTQFAGIDIPGTTGGQIAYVGFTGATGGANAEQDISNWSFNGTAIPFVAPVTVAAPKVTNVYVSGGSNWSTNFKNYIASHGLGDATYGYSVPFGANQLLDMPWTNISQISIKFDSDVVLTQNALAVHGVNTPVLATSGFSYDLTNHVATWTFASSLTKDKLNLGLASAGVTLAGNPAVTLDGEFTTSTTTGSSGDGTAGGNFNFRVNVLPGDVNQTSPVIASDVSLVKNRQLTSTTVGNYGIFFDVDGSGTIIASDVSQVQNRQLSALPGAEPVPGSAVVESAPVMASALVAPSATTTTTTVTKLVKPVTTPAGKPVTKPVVVKPVTPAVPARPPTFAVQRIKKDDLFK